MHSSTILCPLVFATITLAEPHYFFSGSFAGSEILGVEFEETTSTLNLINNITIETNGGSKWIAIDERKQNVYVGTQGYYQSYAITANKSLEFVNELALSSDCQNANFIASAASSPFTVFGVAYSTGCSAQVMSVDESGALSSVVTNLTYGESSGVHGLDLSPKGDFVYSADDMGDAVWVHSYDSDSQTAEQIQYLAAPSGADPRHLSVHPNGQWVYVLYEKANLLAVYSRDDSTGLLTQTNTTYDLLPTGYTNTSSYWADEVKFSNPTSNTRATSPKYLITSTRSLLASDTGYISAFALDAATGAITEQLFITPSTASGGGANAVSPALFSEDYFAITNNGTNFIEMWKISKDGNKAAAIAHLEASNYPANVVWVN